MNFIFENKCETSSILSLPYKFIFAWLIQVKNIFQYHFLIYTMCISLLYEI